MSDQKPRVAFLGLGAMGVRMARRLLDAGYSLTVYNRDRSKAESLGRHGAKIANTPREAAAACDVLISCVTDDAAVEAIYLGNDGAIHGLQRGSTVIELSTASPKISHTLFNALSPKGVTVLEGGVSGSTPQAEDGALVILIGGEHDALHNLKPLLLVMGKAVHHMGGIGSGKTMKLVINMMLGVSMQMLGEALAIGIAGGLEKNTLIDVLGQTAVVSPTQTLRMKNARSNTYPVTFPMALMHKDFTLAQKLAAAHSLPTPTIDAAAKIFAEQTARGVQEDFSTVIRLSLDAVTL